MRVRLLAVLMVVVILPAISMRAAWAAPTWAQEQQEDEEEGDGGEREVESEVGTEEGQSEEAAEEEGPPWTYQMARISLALLAFLALAIGGAYYRFVVMRQRGEA